ncbi:MAG: nickel pincer cofactor biosynthesis protein LarB [Acidobacteriota bacterium]
MGLQPEELLRAFKRGEVGEEDVLHQLLRQPFQQHLIGRFDHMRASRTGIPEAILAEGKDPAALREIFTLYLERRDFLMATRVGNAELAALEPVMPDLQHFPEARIVATRRPEVDAERPNILVASAGALDRPVAEEAAVTCEILGNPVSRLFDVGVAGLNRLASELDFIDRAGVIIVVAGMDGVLPSVIGGLAHQPAIAVPTSVGYGASFGGLAPLLTMLNSCAPGTAVMNIDNGFGAACMATKINQLVIGRQKAAAGRRSADDAPSAP